MKKVMIAALVGSMLTAYQAGAQEGSAKPSWVDNLKMGGDVRFRFQNTKEDGKDSRERWRFRARIGLDGKVNDEVKATVRLVTNSGDPISDNQTMDNYFEDKQTRFDRAFLTYTPAITEDMLSLRFGKMSQPWVAVNDLVFSGDVNPEGVAANAKLGVDIVELLAHGGAFVLKERSSGDETMLFTGQAAAKFKIGEKKDYVMVGGTIYSYDHVKGIETLGGQNSTVEEISTGDEGEEITIQVYDTEFKIVEGFVKAQLNLGAPMTFAAQYMVNTEADKDDTGYLVSADVKLPAGFAVGYQYRYLEKDSAFGYLAENTDFGSSTDVKGHIPYVSCQIGKNFSLKAQYAMGQRGLSGGKDIDTFKIDLSGKF